MRERRTDVNIYWVPGQMVVEANGKANEMAKESVERAGTQRYPEQFVHFAHVS